jgi:hypothetical protein
MIESLIALIAFIALLMWWLSGDDEAEGRCPTCGVDRGRYPHKPHCNYWRDR